MSMILDAFVSKLLDGLIALVNDEVAMLLGVTDEIKRLQKNFTIINTVLADAERKKIQSELINNWLKKLKDIMYDADDILDECRIEAEKSKAAASSGRQPCSSCWTSVCGRFHLFSCSCFGKIASAHQIGRRIQDLNDRLKDIWEEKSKLNLQLSSTNQGNVQNPITSQVSRKTSPIAEPDIVGSNIEKDTDKLVELLIKEDAQEDILVYAIVGIGGIGKTTLARRTINDERITANFPMKLWVCVSKDFEEKSLLKDVITQAGDNPGGDSSRAQLEKTVENCVTNKKFFLVLDDLWDSKVWNDLLRNPLQRGATGSRVLVTTRNEAVALQMKAVKPHHQVEALSAEVGWELLRKNVIGSGEEGEIEDLKDIGMDIVEKCAGLPLAIKTIGGVLSAKSWTRREWDKVLKVLLNSAESFTSLPEGVQPVLYLSYDDLPSHLKQCFLYCSLFPEDYEIHRRFLIHFWISEGFIHEEGYRTLEELGEDYYGELVQRSFFQPNPWAYDYPRCTVHDLLWSLARFLARDENTVLKDGVDVQINSPLVKPRRLNGYVTKENRQAFIDALEGHNSLRTLLLCLGGSQVEENDVNNLVKKTPRLRVLDLSGSKIIKLPDSLGNLIHLRYLALSDSHISEIPESIGNLVNLQFLILQVCKNLRSLPKAIGKLHNLRSLDLIETELDGIPIDIKHLHRLNTLIHFVVRNSNSNTGWCTLEELTSLKKLELLVIKKLERALNEGEVRRANALRDMLQLEVLELSCTPGVYDDDKIKRIEEIFEEMLCPPPQLESLTIGGFFGLHYPSWIASSSTYSLLSYLRRLHLSGNMCPQLPPLGKLPNLDYLYIGYASAVTKIGTEFLGQGIRDRRGRIQIFPKLTNLIFEGMANWEEWKWEKDDDRLIALPNLKELSLYNCPKLMSLPSGLVHHATTLTTLQISYCDSLKAIRGFSSVKELEISDSRNLEDVSDLPNLELLKLEDHEMRSLPGWFHGGQPDFPALNKLEIIASDQQLRGCLKDGLDWPKIEHIRYVSAKNPDGSKYVSKSRYGFSTNSNDYIEDEYVDAHEVLPSQ